MIEELSGEEAADRFLNKEYEPCEFLGDEGDKKGGGVLKLCRWGGTGAERIGRVWNGKIVF